MADKIISIDELSRDTLKSYFSKAMVSSSRAATIKGAENARKTNNTNKKIRSVDLDFDNPTSAKRIKGTKMAMDKLYPKNEEVEPVDEVLDTTGKEVVYAAKAIASGTKAQITGDKKTLKKRTTGMSLLDRKLDREKLAKEDVDNNISEEEMDNVKETTLDLIVHSLDQKPVEFTNTFNTLLQDRLQAAVEQKRQELAKTLFRDEDESDAEEAEDEVEEVDVDNVDTEESNNG